MESTGVYGKPVFNILEGTLQVILVNAEPIKQVPGRKTDVQDCPWIAQRLQHGLLKASFVPPLPTRALASWAGMCSGNNARAGKRRSGRIAKGNRWLKRILVQAAWAASHTKAT
jgi:transposase